MACRIEFPPQAAREFEALDGSLKKLAAKQLDKLAQHPELGEPLGNRMGIDLTPAMDGGSAENAGAVFPPGYRKIYFGKKAYRIVYETQRQKLVILVIDMTKLPG